MFSTFKSKIFAAAIVTLGAFTSTQALADRYERWICIENAGMSEIVAVRISHVDRTDWSRNLIRGDYIDAGDTMTVEPRRDEGYCRFDIRIEFADGEIQDIWNVNLCAATNLRVNEYGNRVV